MGFLDEYKKLDNLCKDAFKSDKGVTAYIQQMEMLTDTRFKPDCWYNDYKKLKHCRHIRNQIAHDNYATEANTSTPDDVKWVKQYYSRILNSEDSLTLYYSAQRKATRSKKKQVKPIPIVNKPTQTRPLPRNPRKVKTITTLPFFVTIISMIITTAILWYLIYQFN